MREKLLSKILVITVAFLLYTCKAQDIKTFLLANNIQKIYLGLVDTDNFPEIRIKYTGGTFEGEVLKKLFLQELNDNRSKKILDLIHQNFEACFWGTGIHLRRKDKYNGPKANLLLLLKSEKRNLQFGLLIGEESFNSKWIYISLVSIGTYNAKKRITWDSVRCYCSDNFAKTLDDLIERVQKKEIGKTILASDLEYAPKEEEESLGLKIMVNVVMPFLAFAGGLLGMLMILNLPEKTRRWTRKKKLRISLIYALFCLFLAIRASISFWN